MATPSATPTIRQQPGGWRGTTSGRPQRKTNRKIEVSGGKSCCKVGWKDRGCTRPFCFPASLADTNVSASHAQLQ